MGRRNFLVDGISGTGKTSVCQELRRRGIAAVNGDRELAYQGDPETGEPVADIAGLEVHGHHLWDARRVRAIAGNTSDPVTFFCGGSRNTGSILDVFDGVFILTVDLDTLERRLDGRGADEWAGAGRLEERALVRRLHANGSDVPDGVLVDGTQPIGAVVDELLRRCGAQLG
ncbi:nucleoside kinase [Curtobacterium sp. Leaf261]|uniref:nucleoside kinase n=1 Tax=Curtobacterium sp. Leaf261 TaxID=1736311 RepID=UPI0007019318|nr:nucleoside kinase [Curtobacterium sp. Leaf261]KQO63856.1 nucleoside kinase [Curtobacterium sp. Leaf261]